MKNKSIECLRGILILLILFYHYTYRFYEIYNISILDFYGLKYFGVICVGAFFCISGLFILPKNAEKYKFRNYMKKKILRLYPLYLICMTITFGAISIFGLPNRESTFFDYILNIFAINGFIGTNYVDGAHWYLTYLIIFYMWVGFLYRYLRDSNKICIVLLVIKDLVKVFTYIFSDFNYIYNFVGANYTEFLIIGICIMNIFNNYRNDIYNKNVICSIILIIISFAQIAVLHNIFTMIVSLIFCLILAFCLKFDFNVFDKNLLYIIGKKSYALYLIHQNIGFIILLKIYQIKNTLNLIDIFVCMIVMLIFAYIIDNIYYSKIDNKITKLLEKRKI